MSNTPKRKGGSTATAKKKRPPLPTVDTVRAENPWPKRLAYIAGGVFVLIILAAVLLGGGDDDLPDGAPLGVQTVLADLPDPEHREGDIEYDNVVPAGGPHNGTPFWQNCGFYDGEIRPENAVHSLEHGAVWVTYRRDLGEENIEALRDLTRRRPQLLVSEVPDLDTPLRATAWGVRLPMDEYDDVTLRQFIVEFTDGAFAPEAAANCEGGIGNPA